MRPTEPAAGALFETFIANELSKQLTWSATPVRLYHFRDSDGAEVGLVLHTGQRRLPLGDRLMALPASDLWS